MFLIRLCSVRSSTTTVETNLSKAITITITTMVETNLPKAALSQNAKKLQVVPDQKRSQIPVNFIKCWLWYQPWELPWVLFPVLFDQSVRRLRILEWWRVDYHVDGGDDLIILIFRWWSEATCEPEEKVESAIEVFREEASSVNSCNKSSTSLSTSFSSSTALSASTSLSSTISSSTSFSSSSSPFQWKAHCQSPFSHLSPCQFSHSSFANSPFSWKYQLSVFFPANISRQYFFLKISVVNIFLKFSKCVVSRPS